MSSQRLLYRYNLDRDYFVPFLQIFQPLYGVAIIPLHMTAFCLLICHTKKWAKSIRAGYLLTQMIMLGDDLWTCLLFRGYIFLPNPIAMCTGPVCGWIGPTNSLTMEHFFMIHAIGFFQLSLFLMQQQVAKLNSSYVIPKWAQLIVVGLIYAALWANVVASILTSGDVPDAAAIVE
ncbi:hypothetical protein PRIPAC_97888, partial [Pristionchus pacificus]|uniref:G protein-coupled receptor n=1 Tax=Pristionchus pacificus TaxID=54126 RepID=A0A2A6BJ14_PRIPA